MRDRKFLYALTPCSYVCSFYPESALEPLLDEYGEEDNKGDNAGGDKNYDQQR